MTTLDVRDGSERDDTISIKSGIISGSRLLPGGLSRPGETKAWLKRRVTRTQSNTSGLPGGGDDDSEVRNSRWTYWPTNSTAFATSTRLCPRSLKLLELRLCGTS